MREKWGWIDGWIGVVLAVMWALYESVVMKQTELKGKAQFAG